jgi:hypothetical protein
LMTGFDDRLCLTYQGLMKNARSTAVQVQLH